MGFVALLVAAKFALYLGFFFLLARILDVGTPLDALRASAHRTWLGAAATLATLMSYMVLRLLGATRWRARFEHDVYVAGTVRRSHVLQWCRAMCTRHRGRGHARRLRQSGEMPYCSHNLHPSLTHGDMPDARSGSVGL